MAAPATIYKIGPFTGTTQQLAKITGVNMYGRVELWKNGRYTAEECMHVGPIEHPEDRASENRGTDEWQELMGGGDDINNNPLELFAKQVSSG